jgi:hypothetical protein
MPIKKPRQAALSRLGNTGGMCRVPPHSISLPEGESILFTLSLRERVAKGRVRAYFR